MAESNLDSGCLKFHGSISVLHDGPQPGLLCCHTKFFVSSTFLLFCVAAVVSWFSLSGPLSFLVLTRRLVFRNSCVARPHMCYISLVYFFPPFPTLCRFTSVVSVAAILPTGLVVITLQHWNVVDSLAETKVRLMCKASVVIVGSATEGWLLLLLGVPGWTCGRC